MIGKRTMDRKEAVKFIKIFLDTKKTETSYEELLKAREAEKILIDAIDESVRILEKQNRSN